MKKLSIAAVLLVWVANAMAAPEAGTRPNILFIFSDDHAAHAISAYGSKINKTPNIDRLASEGMLFRNCFATNSICTPSRATILTGKYSHVNGAFNVGDRFDGSQQTFPKLLQKNGYQTAIIGKWHLASDPTGFDYWNILVGQGPYYNPVTIDNGQRVKHEGYTTSIVTDLTLDWLKNKRDPSKPFVMMCQHKAPHRYWVPAPEHMNDFKNDTIPEPPDLFDDYKGRASAARLAEMDVAKYLTDKDLSIEAPPEMNDQQKKLWEAAYGQENAAYAAAKEKMSEAERTRWRYQRYIKQYLRCVASVDESVGALLKYLDESGLAANTIVIYSSDQGFFLGDHGWFDKRFMYEQSIRMPLLVRWPGKVKAGSIDEHIVTNADFAQTFLGMTGTQQPGDMQGRSLVSLLTGDSNGAPWRDAMYYHYYDYPAEHQVRPHYGVRTERYKLIHFYTLDEWELFDLEKDPREMRSVYDDPAYADVRAQLTKRIGELQKELKDDRPTATAKELKELRRPSATLQIRG